MFIVLNKCYAGVMFVIGTLLIMYWVCLDMLLEQKWCYVAMCMRNVMYELSKVFGR